MLARLSTKTDRGFGWLKDTSFSVAGFGSLFVVHEHVANDPSHALNRYARYGCCGQRVYGLSVQDRSFSESCLMGNSAIVEKEVNDMKFRAFKATIRRFDGLLRNDLDPEQKLLIETCRSRLRELARKRNLSESEVFSCIDEISEKLLKAFRKK